MHLVEDLDFDIWGEVHEGRVWLHSRVYGKWTPRLRRRWSDAFKHVRRLFECDVWVCDAPENAPNLHHFLTLFGFKPREFIAANGMIRACYCKEHDG